MYHLEQVWRQVKYKDSDKKEENSLDPIRVELKQNDRYYFPVPEAAFECEELAKIREKVRQLEEEGESGQADLVRKNTFYPRIVEGDSENNEPGYIRVDLSDNGESPLKLRKNPNSKEFEYAITCPSEVRTYYRSPLTELEKGDEVMMEIHLEGDQFGTKEDHLRIYALEDYYGYRHQKWMDTEQTTTPRVFPFATGILSWFFDRTPDLSGRYDGDRFRLISFDAQHPVFRRRSDRRFLEDSVPSSDLVFELKENGRLPRKEADKIEIWWDPRDRDKDPDGVDPSILIHEVEECTETSVILPKRGYFLIKSTTSHGTLKTWLDYSSVDRFQFGPDPERTVGDGWHGFFPENSDNEDGFTLYIPTKGENSL